MSEKCPKHILKIAMRGGLAGPCGDVRVRMSPYGSEHVRKLENLPKTLKKLRKKTRKEITLHMGERHYIQSLLGLSYFNFLLLPTFVQVLGLL